MSDVKAPKDLIQQAWGLLDQGRPPQEVEAFVASITPENPLFVQAQHVRAICALRLGKPQAAKLLLFDAINRGEQRISVWSSLAAVAVALDFPDDILTGFNRLLSRLGVRELFAVLVPILKALGFWTKEWSPGKKVVFNKVLMPLLAALLERRDMDAALELEVIVHDHYVRPREEESHFAESMGQMSELFKRCGRQWREEFTPIEPVKTESNYKIGFFVHNASMLAHIEVMLNTLKGYMSQKERPFEPIVYCFSGESPRMAEALTGMGVRLFMLEAEFPEARDSKWALLLKLREHLAVEGVHQIVWVSMVMMLPLAFSMRLAPVQTWWAMKYRNFAHDDIDGYVTGSALTRFGTLNGRTWRMGMLGVDDWYDASLTEQATAMRSQVKDRFVLMSLGRTEKMQDPIYLGAIVRILQTHRNAIFVWAGQSQPAVAIQAFRSGGVLGQTQFVGWVNTRLYAQVADLFLDTFPFPCGFTLYQAMAAAMPVVIYTSPEAAQTGLWSFLKPVLEDDQGDSEEQGALRALVGDADNPLISIARTPEDYVRLAGRLIDDPEARWAAGQASQAFIARYFSDSRVMGRSFARHFVEVIEEAARQPPTADKTPLNL